MPRLQFYTPVALPVLARRESLLCIGAIMSALTPLSDSDTATARALLFAAISVHVFEQFGFGV